MGGQLPAQPATMGGVSFSFFYSQAPQAPRVLRSSTGSEAAQTRPSARRKLFFWKKFYSGKIFQRLFRLTIRIQVSVSNMSIFEGTIFIFRFFSFIFQFLFSSFLNMNIKYVEIFQVFGNIFSVYKKSENFKVLLVLYSVQCFSKKREPGTASQGLLESMAQRRTSLAGAWFGSLKMNYICTRFMQNLK